MAPKKDVPAALAATSDMLNESIPPAASGDCASLNINPHKVESESDDFIDPSEELKAAQVKLRQAIKPRSLRDTIDLFVKVRNTKWGVSTVNGIAVDLSNSEAQWDKQKHIRPANWVEVAKNKNGFALDIRGDTNQLYFRRENDEKPRPVKGYNDVELGPPQQVQEHWLEKIRPDLIARRDRLVQCGALVPLPGMVASVADIPAAVAAFTEDLNMADRNLAAMAMKR